jgi:D-alanyl-D-alanine carboxypeptidase
MRTVLAFCLALVLGLSLPAHAQLPQPPELAARQYLLIDLSSNQVLAERDADAKADPASLTKLMTAYLVFNAVRDKKLTLEQTLPVSQRAWAERKGGGSLMFIDTTMQPKVDELLKGMIVQSGNDASVALAEGVAGSVEQFVEMMNRQAQAWDMVRLFEAGKEVSVVPVWKGTSATARLGTPGAISVTVPKGEGDRLKTTLERTDPLVAPLTAGQRVGTLKVSTTGGALVAEVPVTALDAVPLAGILGRAWDAVRLWIK